jgi:hypothetical protein
MDKEKIAALAVKLVAECQGDYSLVKNAVEEALLNREILKEQVQKDAKDLFKGQTVPLRMAASIIAHRSTLNYDLVYEVLRTTYPVARGPKGGVHIPAV